jgi:hypothetical protein
MESVDDEPHLNSFGNLTGLSASVKKEQLFNHLNKIVDLYVVPKEYDMSHVSALAPDLMSKDTSGVNRHANMVLQYGTPNTT